MAEALSLPELLLFSGGMFVLTVVFAYLPRLAKRIVISGYLKSFAAGTIIAAIIMDICKDLYESPSKLGPFYAGISFLFLFAIDKLYLCHGAGCDELPKDISAKKAVIFVFALSVHSFLEGLGFGTRNHCWSYFISIVAHKWIEAFAFGVSVNSSPFSSSVQSSLLVLYSSLTPIGMLSGPFLLKVAKNSESVLNAFTGASVGSFFFIGFVEMLGNEFVHKKKVGKKIGALTMGFAMMAGALSFVKE